MAQYKFYYFGLRGRGEVNKLINKRSLLFYVYLFILIKSLQDTYLKPRE